MNKREYAISLILISELKGKFEKYKVVHENYDNVFINKDLFQ
jgi:hypothetical protein